MGKIPATIKNILKGSLYAFMFLVTIYLATAVTNVKEYSVMRGDTLEDAIIVYNVNSLETELVLTSETTTPKLVSFDDRSSVPVRDYNMLENGVFSVPLTIHVPENTSIDNYLFEISATDGAYTSTEIINVKVQNQVVHQIEIALNADTRWGDTYIPVKTLLLWSIVLITFIFVIYRGYRWFNE